MFHALPHESMIDATQGHLAPYATRARDGGERVHPEPAPPVMTPFELDRHRIISATAFRRLQGKTQVFAPGYGDHFRTRLTHTLEAAHIARCVAVRLRASATLADAITLAHDLGHAPFGHAGEAALDELTAAIGGFNHNAHTLRVATYLEHPFPPFRGLNLTDATRAGLAAHETRYDVPSGTAGSRSDVDAAARAPSVEAQIASLADRVAYNLHDLEDAIGAGILGFEALEHVALWRTACRRVRVAFSADTIHAVRRPVLDMMLNTVLAETVEHALELLGQCRTPEDVRRCGRPIVVPPKNTEQELVALEGFLAQHVYRCPPIARADADARRMIQELFEHYQRTPSALPARFIARQARDGADRAICDYIAGMTDRFCAAEHARLVGS
ncbi:MAG: dGTP triphosphohydrolase [Phycisphaerae bacterium]